jgi:hypothetical protein
MSYLFGQLVGAVIVTWIIATVAGAFMRGSRPSERALKAAFIAFAIGATLYTIGKSGVSPSGLFAFALAAFATYALKRWQYQRVWVDGEDHGEIFR